MYMFIDINVIHTYIQDVFIYIFQGETKSLLRSLPKNFPQQAFQKARALKVCASACGEHRGDSDAALVCPAEDSQEMTPPRRGDLCDAAWVMVPWCIWSMEIPPDLLIKRYINQKRGFMFSRCFC